MALKWSHDQVSWYFNETIVTCSLLSKVRINFVDSFDFLINIIRSLADISYMLKGPLTLNMEILMRKCLAVQDEADVYVVINFLE